MYLSIFISLDNPNTIFCTENTGAAVTNNNCVMGNGARLEEI